MRHLPCKCRIVYCGACYLCPYKLGHMNVYTINEDIVVYCLTATSFPAGIAAVYNRLHELYPPGNGRTYYGLSWPDGKGSLIYKAAVSLNETDDVPNEEFEPFTIKKGDYKSELIVNFMQDVQSIGRTFQQLLQDSAIDPYGYCLEKYLNPTDVLCMVKLKDN